MLVEKRRLIAFVLGHLMQATSDLIFKLESTYIGYLVLLQEGMRVLLAHRFMVRPLLTYWDRRHGA